MKRFLLALSLMIASIATPFVLGALIDAPIPTAQRDLESAIAQEEKDEPIVLASDEAPFTDISGHWGETYIQELYSRGAIDGYDDNTFRPDNPVTRSEMIKVILEGFNYTLHSYSFDPYPFTDVDTDDWFRPYVDEAYANGIISATSTFRPSDDSTRAEALKTIIVSSGETDLNAVTPNFYDIDPYSDWVAPYTAYAKARAIVSGDSSGNFNPSDSITRAELCKMVVLTIQYIEGLSES